VGSGAFLVGMMHEIVKCRKVLSTYLGEEERRSIYDFKRHAIQSCLYGVDIDPGAVEIAKLRLWLSLVVDEEDIRQIKPLPNLDYKIVCGNSLLCVERNMFNNELFQKLEELKPLYFDETNAKKKLEYKEQINQLIRQITNNNADFDFEVYFSEVFHEKGGFDVVMANPPYGIVFETAQKSRCESLYSTFIRNNDIYVAFYERGIGLLSFLGQLSYISPNTFLNGDYFKALRKFLTRETVITEIRDYKEIPVFDDPTVFVCVLNCSKRRSITYPYQVVINIAKGSIDNLAQGTFVIEISSDAQFKASNPIIEKLSNRSKFTMLEDLFFVKDVGFNYWTKGKGKKRDGNSIGDRVFYSGGRCNRNDIPFLKGRDIARWLPKAPSNYLRHNYEDFLDEAIDTLRFSHEYLKLNPKIIYRQTSNTIIAAIDFSAHYVDKTVHLIVPKISWGKCPATLLVGLLNSRLFAYLYSYISQETEGRVFAQVKTTYIKKLPIPQLLNGNSIIVLVDQILAAKRANLAADVLSLEREIDQLVYQLYGLTPEEISVVEGSIRDKA
jgi:hypothetical protein